MQKTPQLITNCKNCGVKFKRFNTIENLCHACKLEKIRTGMAKKTITKKKPKKTRRNTPMEKWSIPMLTETADKEFSIYIRNRDNYICFAKEIPEHAIKCNVIIQNNHLLKRGKWNTRFNELNCHAGCSYHNTLHNTQPQIYTSWFIKKYGEQAYLDLVELSEKPVKKDRFHLIEIILKYRELNREFLQNNDK